MNQELSFYENIINNFISKSEISRIYEHSRYDDISDKWVIPKIRPKKEWSNVKLPNIKTRKINLYLIESITTKIPSYASNTIKE